MYIPYHALLFNFLTFFFSVFRVFVECPSVALDYLLVNNSLSLSLPLLLILQLSPVVYYIFCMFFLLAIVKPSAQGVRAVKWLLVLQHIASYHYFRCLPAV